MVKAIEVTATEDLWGDKPLRTFGWQPLRTFGMTAIEDLYGDSHWGPSGDSHRGSLGWQPLRTFGVTATEDLWGDSHWGSLGWQPLRTFGVTATEDLWGGCHWTSSFSVTAIEVIPLGWLSLRTFGAKVTCLWKELAGEVLPFITKESMVQLLELLVCKLMWYLSVTGVSVLCIFLQITQSK